MQWLFFGALGGVSVCAVQLFLSMVIRAFAPSPALGLAGGIFGLLMTAQGFGYGFPYPLLCLGMRADNPKMALDILPFFVSWFCTAPGLRLPGFSCFAAVMPRRSRAQLF